jgi:hypothetical protein
MKQTALTVHVVMSRPRNERGQVDHSDLWPASLAVYSDEQQAMDVARELEKTNAVHRFVTDVMQPPKATNPVRPSPKKKQAPKRKSRRS